MKTTSHEITCRELQDKLAAGEPVCLLDCRTSAEHRVVALPDTILIPMNELPNRIGELAGKERLPIVVYCHLGVRSSQVADWLREQGFLSVQSLSGGIDAWAAEIDPALPRY